MARRIRPEDGRAALAGVRSGQPETSDLPTAVRYLLQLLAEKAPGSAVEVRVPPFGVVQAIEGPRHTRGTPPNVVEMDPMTWIAVALGEQDWNVAVSEGTILASGTRAHLADVLPPRP